MTFIGLEPDKKQSLYIQERSSENRGGVYSSFRDPKDVLNRWQFLRYEDMISVAGITMTTGRHLGYYI